MLTLLKLGLKAKGGDHSILGSNVDDFLPFKRFGK